MGTYSPSTLQGEERNSGLALGEAGTPALGEELPPTLPLWEEPQGPSGVAEGPLTQSVPFPGPRLRRQR